MGQRAVRPPTHKDQKPCPPAHAGPRAPRSRAPLGPRPCKAPQRSLAPSNTTTFPPKVKGVTNCIRRSPKSMLVLSLPKEAESNGSSRKNQVKPSAVKLPTSRGPALFILPVLSLSKEAQRRKRSERPLPFLSSRACLPCLPQAGSVPALTSGSGDECAPGASSSAFPGNPQTRMSAPSRRKKKEKWGRPAYAGRPWRRRACPPSCPQNPRA